MNGAEGAAGLLATVPVQYWVSAGALLLWLAVDRLSRASISRGADRSGLAEHQERTAVRTVRIITGVVCGAVLIFVWGIDVEGVLLLATTLVTLTGVALFAQWSLLSNVTAFFVLLAQASIRRGAFVRVLELDNYLEGTIADIGPFHTRLVTEDRVYVLIPNTVLLSRTVMLNPRDRLNVVGKLPAAPGAPEADAAQAATPPPAPPASGSPV